MTVKFMTKIKRWVGLSTEPQVSGGASPGPIFRPIFTKLEKMRDLDVADGDKISNEEY